MVIFQAHLQFHYMNFFGFTLTSLFIILFSIGLFFRIGNNKLGRICAFLFFVGGLLFFSLGVFPCDDTCFENYTIIGKSHEILSGIALSCAVIALLFLSHYRHKNMIWHNIILLSAVISLVCGVWYPYMNDSGYAGLIQRFAVAPPFIIVAIASIRLFTSFLRAHQ